MAGLSKGLHSTDELVGPSLSSKVLCALVGVLSSPETLTDEIQGVGNHRLFQHLCVVTKCVVDFAVNNLEDPEHFFAWVGRFVVGVGGCSSVDRGPVEIHHWCLRWLGLRVCFCIFMINR